MPMTRLLTLTRLNALHTLHQCCFAPFCPVKSVCHGMAPSRDGICTCRACLSFSSALLGRCYRAETGIDPDNENRHTRSAVYQVCKPDRRRLFCLGS
ncbi:hypothetical protein HDV57DRAFT_398756 [Trichoderma longibrachiatum]